MRNAEIFFGSYTRKPARTLETNMAQKRPGQRLKKALVELGPAFVKLGQALSVRPDLIGDTLADDLQSLQDQLPPFDGTIAKQTIEAELNKPAEELFKTFELEPIAAASIAQVHRATLADGGIGNKSSQARN